MLYISAKLIPTKLQKVMLVKVLKLLLVTFISLVITSITNAQEINTLKVTGIEGKLALFQSIEVKIDGLEQWVTKNPDVSKFVLYIDGDRLQGLPPRLIQKWQDGKTEARLRFDLKRNEKNKATWDAILSRKPRSLFRTVSITVGIDNGTQVQSSVIADFIFVKEKWLVVFTIAVAIFLASFYVLARNSDIIRVPGAQPENGKPENGKRKPYSLARTQMACWFLTVVVCYVFIWLVTTDLATLTDSVLWIMGISGITGLSSAVIDSNNAEREQAGAISEGKPVQVKPPEETKGFLADILNDDNGVSFHRFQMVIWTLVLIVIFVAATWNVLAMPDFDATLLGLMGISGGTYLGFKLPKQQG
ncbi:MAG: hypothetical protein JNN15_17715 [Blastocatellia bacterium]|nr:hypothetical protein [Blastocatellia bacterium]